MSERVYLSGFDLQQLDEQKLKTLPAEQKDALWVKLLWDLQKAREPLKANSQTSSRPPSSDLLWQGKSSEAEDSEEAESASAETEGQANDEVEGGEMSAETSPEPAKGALTDPATKKPKKPGRGVGAAGHSCELNLPISDTVVHQEFLGDGLGVALSTRTINPCIHGAGRAVEPIEGQRVEELQQASLAYADEMPWKEWGQLLWLWVITTLTVCLYFIGDRSQEILANVFGEGFVGGLMSDGYQVYRWFQHRLRCWAHLQREVKGLKDSLNAEARAFGQATDALLNDLMKPIYQAREGPPCDLTAQFQDRLDAFARCEQYRDSTHEKTCALAREFLNDWEAIGIVVAHPHLPLTNNEAERALRHWVIARRISQGTRAEQGSRVVALLASVIDTCRKRHILPLGRTWPRSLLSGARAIPYPPLPAAS